MWERGGAEEEWNNGGSSGRRRSTEELAGGRRGAKLRSLQRREMAETRYKSNCCGTETERSLARV
jgi:hypothetical protein